MLQFFPDDYRDDDEMKCRVFMAGLQSKYKRRLTEFEIMDFSTLVEKARMLEKAEQMGNE